LWKAIAVAADRRTFERSRGAHVGQPADHSGFVGLDDH
jgi:hypothetical protein